MFVNCVVQMFYIFIDIFVLLVLAVTKRSMLKFPTMIKDWAFPLE